MNEEEKKALKVINARTRRLLDELEIEKEDMSDEPKIAYLMQEIRANKMILNLIEKLQKENEGLKEYIAIAPNLDEMTAIKYRNIRRDAYIQGRAEEQQKAEQIIYENYIPIQKIKDRIEKLDKKEQKLQKSISSEEREEYSDANISWSLMDINIRREVLKELIEERSDANENM